MEIAELRKETIGSCKKKCISGAISKDGVWVDCECMVQFKTLLQYVQAGVSERFMTFEATEMYPKFLEIGDNEKKVNKIINYAKHLQKNVAKGAGLYLWGGPGLGKSALAQWLAKEAIKSGIPTYVIRLSEIAPLIYSAQTDLASADRVAKLRKAQLVVLEEADKEYRMREGDTMYSFRLMEVVSEFYDRNTSLILTSNCSLKDLDKHLPPSVVDRFREVTTIHFEGGSFRKPKWEVGGEEEEGENATGRPKF